MFNAKGNICTVLLTTETSNVLTSTENCKIIPMYPLPNLKHYQLITNLVPSISVSLLPLQDYFEANLKYHVLEKENIS